MAVSVLIWPESSEPDDLGRIGVCGAVAGATLVGAAGVGATGVVGLEVG